MTSEAKNAANQSDAIVEASAATELAIVDAEVVEGEVLPPAVIERIVDPHLEAALTDSVGRLEEVVDEETMALLNRAALDLNDINRRKSRSLLELTRLSRSLPGRVVGGDLGPRLERLGAKLERNQELLKLHLTAAQEVAGIISEALRSADSDGTYSSVATMASRGR